MEQTRKVLIWITGGSVMFCGLCGVGLFNGFGQPKREYRAELAEGVKVGLPANPDEYERRVNPSDNSAFVYRKAAILLTKFEKENRERANRLAPSTISDTYPLAMASADLMSISQLFEVLDQAASMPDFCLEVPYRDGFWGSDRTYRDMRSLLKIRTFRAQVLAMSGRPKAAYAELVKAAAIPRQLGQDNPNILTLLVQLSMRNMVLRGLEKTLCEQGRTREAESNSAVVVRALGPDPDFKLALRGEYGMTLGSILLMENPKRTAELSKKASSEEASTRGSFTDWPTARHLFSAKWLKGHRQAYVVLGDLSVDDRQFFSMAAQLDNLENESENPFTRLSPWSGTSYKPVVEAISREAAQQRLVGILAASLSQSAGVKMPRGIAVDPFTHKPFIVENLGKSFRVWSTGSDGHDNHGLAIRPNIDLVNDQPREYDLVVGYPYVPKTEKERSQTVAGG